VPEPAQSAIWIPVSDKTLHDYASTPIVPNDVLPWSLLQEVYHCLMSDELDGITWHNQRGNHGSF
jgi:hypothetical protein